MFCSHDIFSKNLDRVNKMIRIQRIVLWLLEIIVISLLVISAIADLGVTGTARDLFYYRCGLLSFFLILSIGILAEIDPIGIKKSLPLIKSSKITAHILYYFVCVAVAFSVFGIFYNMTSTDFRNSANSSNSDKRNEEESFVSLKELEDETASTTTEALYVESEENEQQEHATNLSDKHDGVNTKAVNDFYIDFMENGNYESIRELAKKHGVYMNHRKDGIGHDDYVIASNKEESKISLLDVDWKGTYCVTIIYDLIKDEMVRIELINNIDHVISTYRPGGEYTIYDRNRLTPVEDDSAYLHVDNPREVIDYVPYVEEGVSELENFFKKLEYGDSFQNVLEKVEEAGLYIVYSRHGDSITYAKDIEDYRISSHISVVFEKDILVSIGYIDYPLNKENGIGITKVSEEMLNDDEKGSYSHYNDGAGYYIYGKEFEPIWFESADEALAELRRIRKNRLL